MYSNKGLFLKERKLYKDESLDRAHNKQCKKRKNVVA